MRLAVILTPLFYTIIASILVEDHIEQSIIAVTATPASVPTRTILAATTSPHLDNLEFHQAPDLVPEGAAMEILEQPAIAAPIPTNPILVASSTVTSATSVVSSPSPSPAIVTPVPQISTTTSKILSSQDADIEFVTIQWVETWIGGTYSTWVPRTITFRSNNRTPGPLPGKGEIGMGTLVGEIGKTKTEIMGAAPARTPSWAKGLVAVVGAGLAGLAL